MDMDHSNSCSIVGEESAQRQEEITITPCIESKNEDVCKLQSDNKLLSLGVIAAEYKDLESDTEELVSDNINNNTINEVQIVSEEHKNNYRSSQVESSNDDSDSEDDSSSSSSDSDSSDSSDNDNSDDSVNSKCSNDKNRRLGKGRQAQKEPRSEFDDLPPIEDLKISVPEVLCDPFGEVAWMVEQLVIVRPKPDKPTLNLDTVLFVEKGQRALGRIFDVFGQVAEPYYCVRFNSSEHIKESDITVGMTTYYCPNTPYTSLVFLHELVKMKGSDAVGDDEHPEFSDDEEERKYYESLKQKQQSNKNTTTEKVKNKRRRTSSSNGWQSNHPWNKNTCSDARDARPHAPPGAWPSPYQNKPNWPPMMRPIHPVYGGYPTYASGPPYPSPRIPFGAYPLFPPGVVPHPFPAHNARPPFAGVPWPQPPIPQPPPPWIPPPPPSPPPSGENV